jgi:hypothetical protein
MITLLPYLRPLATTSPKILITDANLPSILLATQKHVENPALAAKST